MPFYLFYFIHSHSSFPMPALIAKDARDVQRKTLSTLQNKKEKEKKKISLIALHSNRNNCM